MLRPSQGGFRPAFVMRTRASCGQGIGWRARAARRPARRSWRCHDSEPCGSRIGISSPGTRARPWRGFFRTDGCVGVAISTVGARASLSPLRPTERPRLPPAVASVRWHNHCRHTPPAGCISIDTDVCLHAKVPLVALPSRSALRIARSRRVIGQAMHRPVNSLKARGESTNAGRRPACSLATDSRKSSQIISPVSDSRPRHQASLPRGGPQSTSCGTFSLVIPLNNSSSV